jgi:hypothetical protein
MNKNKQLDSVLASEVLTVETNIEEYQSAYLHIGVGTI